MFKYFTPIERFPKPKNIAKTNDSQPNDDSSIPSPSDIPTEPCSSRKVFKKGAYLESDPGIRSQIMEYHPNDQDEVRRAYLLKGPCKPKIAEYPLSDIGGKARCFQYSWHEEFDWLEYSKENDVVFCLPCYVCYKGASKPAFVKTGFKGWNLKHKLGRHVGDKPNSYHNRCVKACEDLMKVNQSIEYSYAKHSTKEEADYLVRLKASLEAVKFLVRGGLAFTGHDEGEDSVYKGYFLEILNVFARISEEIATAMAKRLARSVTNFHYYKNDCYLHAIDLVLQELNDRFTPENIELLSCVACSSPCDPFEAFDTKSLVRLARLYPSDFEDLSDKELSSELETYIVSVKMDDNFSNLSSISDLGRTLVRTKKHTTFRFVYTLVKLALTLPVATANVEQVFSGMKYIKNQLRSRMTNPWLNDCLVTFVEKKVFSSIDDMDIIKRFHVMSKRRMHLCLD